METTRPPGFPGNPPARMPRAPTPARSPPPRPLRCGEIAFRPTHDVGPHKQCISGLNHAAYGLPVNASRPGSPQAHASLGSGWRPTLAGWDWIPTGFRTRFRRSHHGILSSLTGLSRHTRCCMNRSPHRSRSTAPSPTDAVRHWPAQPSHLIQDVAREDDLSPPPCGTARSKAVSDDRRVPEERVLHAGLPMIARHLLPASPSYLLDRQDRVITGARTRAEPYRISRMTLRRPGSHAPSNQSRMRRLRRVSSDIVM